MDLEQSRKPRKPSSEEVLEATTVRLIALMFAAFDTTSLTLSQLILDVMSQDQVIYANAMKEEAISTIAADDGNWTLRSLQNLKLIGSFLRESQRLHPIGISLAARKVTRAEGWTFSNGDCVSFGDTVTVPTFPLQRDEDIYTDANKFQGFRFIKSDKSEADEAVRDTFLAFGYGRHAWSVEAKAHHSFSETIIEADRGIFSLSPGRSLALAILKIVIAQFLINYEYKPLAIRPKDGNLGNYLVPPFRTKVTVRRRVD